MKELRVGVVGLGWVAGAHIDVLNKIDGVRVTSVCSRRPLDGKELSKRFNSEMRVYSALDDMLRDDAIDIVDICTPHPLHAQQAIAVAKARKHLIIEKPLCLAWQDALAVRDAIKAAGTQTCVCFEGRYSTQFTLTKSIVDQGLIGEIHYAEVDYFHGIGPWYKQFEWNIKKDWGGSSLLTAGCHALDLLLFLMNEPVEEVTSYSTKSRSATFAPYEYDTTSTTLVRFAGGKVGKTASVTDCLQPYYFHTHLVGSEGSLLDDRFYSTRMKGLSKDGWSKLNVPMFASGDVKDHPYEPQFQAFIDSVRRGEHMPLTDFATALETHRVIFAADRSAAERRPVRLSEFPL